MRLTQQSKDTLAAIRDLQGATAADLCAALGVPKSSMDTTLRILHREGLVARWSTRAGEMGRPAAVWEVVG